MTIEYALIALYIIGFLLIIQKWSFFQFTGLSKRWLQLAFLLKIMAGFGLYWLYTVHYPIRSNADIFKYFDDSEVLFSSFAESKKHFFQMLFGVDCEGQEFRELYYDKMNNWYKTYDSHVFNNNRTMIRINGLMRFVSNGSYHIHSIIMSFVGLIGLTLLLRAFKTVVHEYKTIAIVLVLLLPSTLLWTSGDLKEPMLFLFLGGAIWSMKNLKSPKWWLYLLIFACCLCLIFITKYYVLVALLPAMLAYISGFWIRKRIPARYVTAILLCVIGAIVFSYIKPDLHFAGLIGGKRNDMVRHAQEMDANSLFDSKIIEREWTAVLSITPKALWNAIIQPIPTKTSSTLHIIAFAENIFVLFFLATCIIFRRAGPDKEAIWLITVYVLTLYIILGLSTPVSGALVRYKTPGLPMLMILGLLIAGKEKLTSKNPLLNRIIR